MKVLWISDFNINNNPGGSQRTDDEVIRAGLSEGHNITRFNIDDSDELLKDSYDIVVSNNLEHMRNRRPNVFGFILNHPNHIRFEHDSNAYLTVEDRKALFGKAKRNLFLSRYHHDTFVELYGSIFHSVDIITSPISEDFKILKGEDEREDSILSLGFMHFLKGTHNFFAYALRNPQKNFVVAGWGPPNLEMTAKRLDNVKLLGTVPYDQMPLLLNQYKTLYYHPAKFEPFCRSVGEAILCGMKLDVSGNIGAVRDFNQYGLEGLRKMCLESKHKFWKLLREQP